MEIKKAYSPSRDIEDVIKAVEICKGTDACSKCPYFSKDGKNICRPQYGDKFMNDILYYLKKKRWGIAG